MNSLFFPNRTYLFLFALLGLAYIPGLFVTLMDNDSAHHADIALHMYLNRDYVNLIDAEKDYLDKPHLHFWLCAFSYKIFGITSFAYRFPSFLFTILGTYAVFRLGKTLYHSEVGKLAALVIASSFAYILANNDVRMEAILTACIAFSTWQGIEFVKQKRTINAIGLALGLALGFSTKGHIAVLTPGIAIFFYMLYRKDWKLFLNWRWLLTIILFALFIFPVVYCYYLQYNLHPEKVVRGKDHINGVLFILWSQSIERFGGQMQSTANRDSLFFLHSFLWAFVPWSILTYIAIGSRLKKLFRENEEWVTSGVIIVIAITVTLSKFKLPHYLNITFPVSAVLTAAFILNCVENLKWSRAIFIIQLILIGLILLLSAFVHAWAFPISDPWITGTSVLLLALVFYFLKSMRLRHLQKMVAASVSVMTLVFFLLNSSFYPQLLRYQAGQTLAETTKQEVAPGNVYVLPDSYSASYAFYTRSLPKRFHDSLLQANTKIWLLTEPEQFEEFRKKGYQTGVILSAKHFRVSQLTFKFLNPWKRDGMCSKMMLVQVIGKN